MRSFCILVFAVLMAGCGSDYGMDPVTNPAPNRVDAVGVSAWSPTPVTIKAGEDVSFRNSSSTPHSVVFDGGVVGHPDDIGIFTQTTKSVTFATAGTFTYHCGIHAAMQGQVIVQP